ncbi:MAG TPA: bifunctional DNA-formamidopyrimidine glycosylase/DNA-(apurinic or apyrimidinic site) lyase, partial [Dehalococcoidia bacterium]|nr:bifunctional DNA-formamidopyrimidine glycosylase/DNA-(apurinic or apyrimidinic site) lyase [Dehalococcoidia bacterium]
HVIGHCIIGIDLDWDGIVRYSSPDEFRDRLLGQTITGISRRGKYLIFGLTGVDLLVMHLKMSGSLLLKPAATVNERFVRAIIFLDNETAILFRDPRKFGRMWLVADTEAIAARLGPEPLSAAFTPELLAQRLDNRGAPIKALLFDQEFIAGIGNMYADEALFAARIHPLRPGKSLSTEEIARLHQAIQRVLRAGINNKGASIENYFRPDGAPGTAHFEFQVAHRRGQNCPVCGTPLQRIVVRNRGTYLCPNCQS